MAYLLILNGQRVDESVELDPGATMTLGSSPSAHIQLAEPYVAEVHGQVYPAEGRYWFQDLGQGVTCHNADAVSGSIHELRPHDVISLGRTFLKFVLELPAALDVLDIGDDEAIEVADGGREAELEEEVATLRGHLEARDRALAEAVAQRDQGLAQASAQLQEQLRQANAAAAQARGEAMLMTGERDALQTSVAQARAELERAQAELAERSGTDHEAELASALETLEAAREALAALGVADAAGELARSAPTDPGTLLDGAELAPELRARLDAGLASYVEREALRRMAGSSPEFHADERGEAIAAELRAARARASDLAILLDVKGPA